MRKYQKQFIDNVETRFKTIMIGSLARVEDSFGFLWGHNSDNPTAKQLEFRTLWEDLRTDILNHGNFHIRNGVDDIIDFLQEEKRYTYQFYINNRRNDNE
jgi:hypothetical protein